jgi:hypothetical protein
VKTDLEERGAAEIALGGELLHQALEGRVLVGIGAEAGLLDLVEQLFEGALVRERLRRTRVLTKKPISRSVSARVRLAMGEPMTTSAGPVSDGAARRRPRAGS